jgi:hydroxymethylbilane synthase
MTGTTHCPLELPSLLRIASRESALAMWQSEHIKQRLETLYPSMRIEIVGMTTQGDRILDVPLARIGGKGLFVKELEQSLLRGETDIAVHSMKDVPMTLPEALCLPIICEREDPFDAFVSNRYRSLRELPTGACVGTSSLRRQCQLLAHRPDLVITSLRGNVNTRLRKLDENEFDAIVLAASGLKRLGFEDRIASRTETELLPAVGQGALGIECRTADTRTQQLLQPLLHPETSICVRAERALNHRLQGGCQVPIAAHAIKRNEQLILRGMVGSICGKTLLQVHLEGPAQAPEALGIQAAEALLAQGAGDLLAALHRSD